MATYTLSIVVYGKGDDPNNRSHWAIVIQTAGASRGNISQVSLIDRDHLWNQCDRRDDVAILTQSSEGYFPVATIFASQYSQVSSIISKVPAPRNGRDRCKDGTMNCISALEPEELLPPGTSEWVNGLLDKSETKLAESLGGRWVTNRR